jgi:hypothetical protein
MYNDKLHQPHPKDYGVFSPSSEDGGISGVGMELAAVENDIVSGLIPTILGTSYL